MAASEYIRNFDMNTGAIFKSQQDGCYPRFFLMKEPDPKTGVIKETEYVEINIRGDRLTRRAPRVTDEHRNRWPREYAAFKNNIELPVDGFPLTKWPDINERMVMELQALGFRTVEDMANAQENHLQHIHQGQGWKKRAQVFLAERNTVKVDERDEKIARLEAMVEQLAQAQNGKVSVSPGASDGAGKRRGRPPNTARKSAGPSTVAAGVAEIQPQSADTST